MNHVVGLLVARISSNLSALGMVIVVGRFLTPNEFGLFAIASSLAIAPHMLIGAGFYEHILARDPERRDERTAFWCCAGMGASVAVLLLGVAGIVWWGFGIAVVAILLMGLAVHSLLWSLYIAHEARQLRDGNGKIVATISASGDVTAFVALCLSVNFDLGVYCLLVNRIVGGSVAGALYWVLTPRPAGEKFNPSRAWAIAKGASGIVGTRLMNWLNGYAGEFAILGFLSTYSVGLYRMGSRLFESGSSIVFWGPLPGILTMIGVAYRAGPARFSTVVRRTTQLHLAFAIPVFALASILAPRFVPLLLGPKWLDSVGVLQAFSLSTVQCVFFVTVTTVLTSSGRTDTLFWSIGTSCVLGFLGICLGAFIGPVQAALGHMIATTPWTIYVFYKFLRLSRKAVVSTLLSAASLSAAGAMTVVAAWGAGILLGPPIGLVAQSTQMMIVAVVALAVFVISCSLLAPRIFRLWRFIIRQNLKRLGARFAILAT